MLHQMLERLSSEYVFERAKKFTGSEFANFVRHDLAVEARKQLIFKPFDLKVKASVGQSNWAAVPWLAFFDPLITESATRGFYVVYLINADAQEITLSLNQGATAVYEEFGHSKGLEVLKRRASDMAERVGEFSSSFSNEPIDLGSEATLPKGYSAGHVFGKTYKATLINEADFYKDLEIMLHAYQTLIDRGAGTPTEEMLNLAETKDIQEAKKYILSRRIERAPNVRKQVLLQRGAICEGCGFDPENHLRFKVRFESSPLDVHHCNPLRTLREGESRRYKVPEDFLVLCPTCHRIIHKQDDPSNLEKLRQAINFNIVVKGIA